MTTNISSAAQKEIDGISKLFQVTDDNLKKISNAFGDAYRRGLQAPNQPIVMGPSFITHVAKGNEKGTFLTLDISYSSIRVSKIDLDGKRSFKSSDKVFDVPSKIMKADAVTFFDFLGKSIKTFVDENAAKGLPLAFIFPFPVDKTSVNKAKCTGVSKGFSIQGIVGQDVSKLLQTSLDQLKVDVKLVALVNDTVAVLLSESYISAPCMLSVIYGAGTNGSYNEVGAAITKMPQFKGESMAINTEWGAFKDRSLLNPSIFDDSVDKGTVNPGEYLFQKLTCWYYLGEISRFIMLSMTEHSPPYLFGGVATDALKKKHAFASFHVFQIDDAKDLNAVKGIIVESLHYTKDKVSDEDAEIVRRICNVVAARSSKLSAAPIAALINHISPASITGKSSIPVAVDGELFIGSAQWETRLKKSIGSILGAGVEQRLEFHAVKQGGVVGAAIAAYDALSN